MKYKLFFMTLFRPSMMTLLFISLILFISWAAIFDIDQSVRAQGQVIASSRTQVIQAVDGGVLSELLVAEGQSVKDGEVLAILEKTRAEAGYEESSARAASLNIALIRAKAEIRLDVPVFGAMYAPYKNVIRAQQNLYTQRRRSLDEDLSSLEQALSMAREELRMNETLLKDGDVSRLDTLRARRQVIDLEAKLASVRNKYLQDSSAEVVKLEDDIALVNSKLAERENVLDHTNLTAPVAGVVKSLRITTIGGVLRAGDELMQIAPTNDELIIEAKVNPMDIGMLVLGLPVSVKLDAFDYFTYGTLVGELTYISPDTLSEQSPNGQSQTNYRVHVKLAQQQSHNGKVGALVVKPGMTATIDIRTGTRSVLKYMAKPVFKAFSGALIER